jgi:hypothetical protein
MGHEICSPNGVSDAARSEPRPIVTRYIQQRLATKEKQRLALELRTHGDTFEEIAREVGYTNGGAACGRPPSSGPGGLRGGGRAATGSAAAPGGTPPVCLTGRHRKDRRPPGTSRRTGVEHHRWHDRLDRITPTLTVNGVMRPRSEVAVVPVEGLPQRCGRRLHFVNFVNCDDARGRDVPSPPSRTHSARRPWPRHAGTGLVG